LTGLPDAIGVTWPAAVVQTCVVHLIRASLRYASKRDWTPLTQSLRPIYTAVDETAAGAALDAFAGRWSSRYPAIVRLWRTHWEQFTPFLAFPPEVRRVIYTTNLIESINARLRKVTRNRGQFPSEQAVLKLLYLAVRNLEEFRRNQKLRLETSPASVHDLLPGADPHPMTATITYTGDRTLPRAHRHGRVFGRAPWVLAARWRGEDVVGVAVELVAAWSYRIARERCGRSWPGATLRPKAPTCSSAWSPRRTARPDRRAWRGIRRSGAEHVADVPAEVSVGQACDWVGWQHVGVRIDV